jgi:hypothetical protein
MFGIDFMHPCPKEDYRLLMFTLHVKTTIVDLTYGSYKCALVVVQLWTLFKWLNATHEFGRSPCTFLEIRSTPLARPHVDILKTWQGWDNPCLGKQLLWTKSYLTIVLFQL